MLWPVGSNSGCLWYELNLCIEILFGVPCPIHHTFFLSTFYYHRFYHNESLYDHVGHGLGSCSHALCIKLLIFSILVQFFFICLLLFWEGE